VLSRFTVAGEVTAIVNGADRLTVLLEVESEKPPVLVEALKIRLVTPLPIVTLKVTGVETLTGTVIPVGEVMLAVPPVGATEGVRVTDPLKPLFGVIVTT